MDSAIALATQSDHESREADGMPLSRERRPDRFESLQSADAVRRLQRLGRLPVSSDLPRWRATLLSIVEQQIAVAGSVTEHPEQKRDLPAMMNTMVRRVLHERSQYHRAFLATRIREFDESVEIVIPQFR